jgi:peptidoglycan hydrolase FlgJ
MTLPVTNSNSSSAMSSAAAPSSADVYTDLSGLAALKSRAKTNDPEALRAVAKQYESLFARMMIKSMRDAVGKDPIFGSDEESTYQEMYDDQLSLEMSKGHGLGLADMLVRQLQRLNAGGKTDAAQSAHAAGAAAAAQGGAQPQALRKYQGPDPQNNSSGRAVTPVASPEAQANFITDVWPAAQEAGQQLGVDPNNLIAQAALETNWGTHVPRDANGRSSNNLFGMKAGGQWNGASITAATQEYQDGTAVNTTGQFRAYASRTQSFRDYVSLLRSSPRYSAALNTGNDTHAFASALQRGGYATDPDYANKITALAAHVSTRSASLPQPLKSASALPLNPLTGIL